MGLRWVLVVLAVVQLGCAIPMHPMTVMEVPQESGAKHLLQDMLSRLALGVDVSFQQVDTLLQDLRDGKQDIIASDQVCANYKSWQEAVEAGVNQLHAQMAGNTCSQLEADLESLVGQRSEIIEQLQAVSQQLSSPLLPHALPISASQVMERPRDCSETQAPSGPTTVYPDGETPRLVRCDQDTDGGGWTVLLLRQRETPQLTFSRNLDQYVKGFGDPEGEHWLGLATLHQLTGEEPMELLVTMARDQDTASSYYSHFSVGGSSDYRLTVSGYEGARSSGGDSLTYHSGQAFTTTDRDRDGASGGSCADWSGSGGWWYNYCFFTNPTGLWGGDRAVTAPGDYYLEWRKWQGYHNFLTDLTMMVRPRKV